MVSASGTDTCNSSNDMIPPLFFLSFPSVMASFSGIVLITKECQQAHKKQPKEKDGYFHPSIYITKVLEEPHFAQGSMFTLYADEALWLENGVSYLANTGHILPYPISEHPVVSLHTFEHAYPYSPALFTEFQRGSDPIQCHYSMYIQQYAFPVPG